MPGHARNRVERVECAVVALQQARTALASPDGATITTGPRSSTRPYVAYP